MTNKREKLFSITTKDCEWSTFRAGGKGGQHQNKTESAVRCVHKPSGAVGECREYREQPMNKKAAFRKMAESAEFKKWVDLEAKRQSGALQVIESEVDKSLKSVKLEVKEDGKWKEVKEGELHD